MGIPATLLTTEDSVVETHLQPDANVLGQQSVGNIALVKRNRQSTTGGERGRI